MRGGHRNAGTASPAACAAPPRRRAASAKRSAGRFSTSHIIAPGCDTQTVMQVFRRGPHDREIVRLAVPALGALAAEPLYLLADTAIVGHLGTTRSPAWPSPAACSPPPSASSTSSPTPPPRRSPARWAPATGGRRPQFGIDGCWLAVGLGVVLTVLGVALRAAHRRRHGRLGTWSTRSRSRTSGSASSGAPALLLTLAGAGLPARHAGHPHHPRDRGRREHGEPAARAGPGVRAGSRHRGIGVGHRRSRSTAPPPPSSWWSVAGPGARAGRCGPRPTGIRANAAVGSRLDRPDRSHCSRPCSPQPPSPPASATTTSPRTRSRCRSCCSSRSRSTRSPSPRRPWSAGTSAPTTPCTTPARRRGGCSSGVSSPGSCSASSSPISRPWLAALFSNDDDVQRARGATALVRRRAATRSRGGVRARRRAHRCRRRGLPRDRDARRDARGVPTRGAARGRARRGPALALGRDLALDGRAVGARRHRSRAGPSPRHPLAGITGAGHAPVHRARSASRSVRSRSSLRSCQSSEVIA